MYVRTCDVGMYVYVHVHVYVYVKLYVYVCVCVHVNVMYTYTLMHMYVEVVRTLVPPQDLASWRDSQGAGLRPSANRRRPRPPAFHGSARKLRA